MSHDPSAFPYVVYLNHDVAYEEVYDVESPWGTTYHFNKELYSWLDERVGPSGWDHDEWTKIHNRHHTVYYGAMVFLNDKRVAIMLALKHGYPDPSSLN